MATDLNSALNNDFTPSTPYVHKFRTEMCKNFELYGKCKYGDEVSSKSFQISTSYFNATLFLWVQKSNMPFSLIIGCWINRIYLTPTIFILVFNFQEIITKIVENLDKFKFNQKIKDSYRSLVRF